MKTLYKFRQMAAQCPRCKTLIIEDDTVIVDDGGKILHEACENRSPTEENTVTGNRR